MSAQPPPGRKNEHNAEFIAKAGECGLIVTKDGAQGYSPESPFLAMLQELGVPVPECHGEPIIPDRPDRPAKEKHRRWDCPCGQSANVAAKQEFQVHCDRCGKPFVPVERRKKQAKL